MKYIKTYEDKQNESEYYIIHIYGNWDIFLIALDKMGIRKDFYEAWSIKGNWDELSIENQAYFKNDQIIFAKITPVDAGQDKYFFVRNNLRELKNDFPEYEPFIFKGDVYVEDYEYTGIKYNL